MFKKANAPVDAHQYVEARLSDYLDEQLPESERALVRQHLQNCDRCQASLRSLSWTVKLLKQVPAPALPRQFTLPVPARARVGSGSPNWLKWGLSAASVAAAFIFLFLLTTDLLSQGPSGRGAQALAPAAAPAPPTFVGFVVTSAPAATSAPASGRSSSAPIPTLAVPTDVAQFAQPTEDAATKDSAAPTSTAPSVSSAALPATEGAPAAGGGGATRSGTSPPFPNQSIAQPKTVAAGNVTPRQENVFSEPNAKSKLLGLLSRGELVQILRRDESGDWLEIIFPADNNAGFVGWVSSKSIKLVGNAKLKSLPSEETTEAAPLQPATIQPTATKQPTNTPSPTLSPTATPSPAPARTETLTFTPTSAVAANQPEVSAPVATTRGAQLTTLRLGEIAAALIALVLGASAFVLARRS